MNFKNLQRLRNLRSQAIKNGVLTKTGKDEVHNIFQDGTNMQGLQNVIQYKSLILRCGFSEKKHRFLNPFIPILIIIFYNSFVIN